MAGPPYPGGTAPRSALCWNQGQKPAITVDLERPEKCGAFRIQLGAGWPWWDALKGQVKDQVEVFTSLDGQEFRSQGFFALNLRWKDFPANHFWPDEEVVAAHVYDLVAPTPVAARYVRFQVTPARTLTVSEVEVLDAIQYEPFDLRVALPDEQHAMRR
ncbi:MAG: discoidin domain-containing protein [Verrucomicrobia bacterium]|nr:discoidin domain-containing protein [Verrucomicrobiota bacterium]